FRAHPALREVVRRLVVVLGGMFKGAAHGREIRNILAILFVTFDRTVAQAQGKGRIWWLAEAALREAGLGDEGAVAPHHRINLIVVLFAKGASLRLNRPHGD